MKIGAVVDRDQWTFFRPVYEDLGRYHQTEAFKARQVSWAFVSGRINSALLQHDLRTFMQRNDLIFFEWAGELLARATRLPKTAPIVTRLHSTELYYAASQVDWEHVDGIILVSKAMKRRFVDRYPSCEDKASVIYLGVDVNRFRPVQRSFTGRLGMLGNIVPIKRIYEVILSLYELRQRGYSLTLRIGGTAPERGEPRYPVRLRELVTELNLHDSVHFDGYVSAPQWLQRIDVLVSNSFWESQHMAMLEAMASGCYCLCHTWPGAEELVPPEVLFTTNSKFLQKVAAYCDTDENGRRVWQEQMRAIAVERFSLERNKREMREFIERSYKPG